MATQVEDFKDRNDNWVGSHRVDGDEIITKAYSVWTGMKCRCRLGSYAQLRQPTYSDCVLGEDFYEFQDFANWYTSQVGYGFPDMDLDKDLLFHNNKIYSPRTCLLIPGPLNSFMVSSKQRQGIHPVGVSYRKGQDKYRAQIRISGVTKLLGDYLTPMEAETAYKIAKINEACRWASRIQSGEFTVNPVVVDILLSWSKRI